jgi:hypothetical protein
MQIGQLVFGHEEEQHVNPLRAMAERVCPVQRSLACIHRRGKACAGALEATFGRMRATSLRNPAVVIRAALSVIKTTATPILTLRCPHCPISVPPSACTLSMQFLVQ